MNALVRNRFGSPDMPIAFLFSGKGSQYFQMGRELYEADTAFRDHINDLDKKAEFLTGSSVLSKVFDPARSVAVPIPDPLMSALAIFMVECALASRLVRAGIKPQLLISASMGIYAAGVLAGFMLELQAMRLLCRSSRIFRQSCEPGSMVTVLASRHDLYASPILRFHTRFAGESFDEHCILAYRLPDREIIGRELTAKGMMFQFLPISRPYHSEWIDLARKPFLQMFESFQSALPTVRLACCSGATNIGSLSGDTIWRAIRSPMYFRRVIDEFEALGTWRYIDVGPSGENATALKYILRSGSGSTSHTILAPALGAARRFADLVSVLGTTERECGARLRQPL